MIAGLYDIFEHWHRQGTCWLMSDSHFNDQELYIGTQRIERADSDKYVKLINSKVGKNDTLIHLGDCGDLDAIRKIRGYKILIAGNHDQGLSNFKRQVWRKKFDANKYDKKTILAEMQTKYPKCIIRISDKCYDVQHAPFEYYFATADNNLFQEVYSGPVQIGEKLILSHEPINCDWAFNIHGHIHDPRHKNDKRHMCICPDVTGNFEPVNFNQLIKSGFMSKIETQHRKTINTAAKRKEKRGKKK